jgi:hypothetical protein
MMTLLLHLQARGHCSGQGPGKVANALVAALEGYDRDERSASVLALQALVGGWRKSSWPGGLSG